ncbi:YheC/YheD family protein [Paenibacillus sp. 1P03SA]|uniref:YheC/YheD family protein n=1 Tax=Paenibacillus sp. 1P03SA TaxID=3132294 RepID=UPI0039A06225
MDLGGYATKQNVSDCLLKHGKIRRNVPETRLYRKSTLKAMLGTYKMVYVKPNSGTGGSGVIRVEREADGYKFQLHTVVKRFRDFASMEKALRSRTKKSPYVIQQGIRLLRHKGRLFDLRIMVQKNPRGNWETTGMIGRTGHPRKIVTNVCRGGSSKPVEVLLRGHRADTKRYKASLRNLGLRAARHLNKTFPRIKEVGLDVGLDSSLHPWILEANPRPKIYGFKTLKNKGIYRKMLRYQKCYGRA